MSGRPGLTMDDYMKEMMDLKRLSLEKKGVLARIQAELRANVFQAIEEQDRVSENEGGESFALLGQCSERAKQLHGTPAGKLLTGLLCEYLEWCELERMLDVYLPELNQTTLSKDSYASSKSPSKPLANGLDEDLNGALESRLNLSK